MIPQDEKSSEYQHNHSSSQNYISTLNGRGHVFTTVLNNVMLLVGDLRLREGESYIECLSARKNITPNS